MKKDKEWLKDKIKGEEHDLKYLYDNYVPYEKVLIADDVCDLIDQLDEPEVTLDKAFEKVAESYLMTKEEIWRHLERLETHGGKVTYDEPKVLSQEWIDEHAQGGCDEWVYIEDLQNLLVPKQEEVDRAHKDGYEKGKKYTFYKGYLEGLADKESETETVADVLADFYKSLERLKKALGTKVEELE